MASSDEEVDQHIVEETYRVGWPVLQPLPSSFRACYSREEDAEYFTDSDEAYGIVHDVLVAQSVEVHRFHLVRQRTAGTSCAVPMFRIEAHNKGSGKASWRTAVLRIVRGLQNLLVGNVQIHVEMVERGYPRLLPAEPEDAAVDIWANKLAPRVMDILERRSMLWQSLQLVRLSSVCSSDRFLTVLIEAADVLDSGWSDARSDIVSALDGTRCRLAIWQMLKVNGLGREDPDPAKLDDRWWGDVMSVGDGIGPAGEEYGAGTVGGLIHLRSKNNGDTSPHILTSFQAIKTPELQQSLEPAPLQSICLPRGSTAYPVKVPSAFESSADLKRFNKSIQDYHTRLHVRYEGRPSCVDRADAGNEVAKRHVEMCRRDIARCEEVISQVVEISELPSGTVRATSGFQHLALEGRKFPLEWALVDVDPERLLSEQPRPFFALSRMGFQGGFEIPPWANNPDQKWSRHPQLSQEVVKLGRMTGWTCGRLGAAPCFYRSLAKDDQVGGWHDRYGTVVECLQVFDRYAEETPEDARQIPLPFAFGGDSGSVVKDFYTGAWVGLLFGSHCMGWALMTPMAAVMYSIESVTGEEVVDPVPLQ